MNSAIQLKSLLEELPFSPFTPRDVTGQSILVACDLCASNNDFDGFTELLDKLKTAMAFMPTIVKRLTEIQTNFEREKLVGHVAVEAMSLIGGE